MARDTDFLDDLNPPQREAVTHTGSPLMVVAGAGSGKTRVITYRIAHLIRTGTARDRILAITFTNKAAREMLERTEALVGPGRLWISTFHGFCARILRRHIDRLPPYTSRFTIYDRDDQLALVKSILKEAGIEPGSRPPYHFLRDIGRAKNDLQGPDDLARRGWARRPGREESLRVFRLYEEALRERNALDFDDLLLLAVRLFEASPDVARFYQLKFQHLLIDEYQDTNRAQYRLGVLLAAAHRRITITGDPDQSIYAWRGADIRNILRFEKEFPDARVIKLEQNYRSTKRILAAAQGLIAHNAERKEKDLWTENSEGARVHVTRADDAEDEGRRLADAIGALGRGGVPLGEIAVFYRINAQSRALETALFKAKIPYVIVGAVAFYARREIKDILAYLRVAVNPRDEESLKRIINVPARGIGTRSLARIDAWARERGLPLRDVLGRCDAIDGVSTRAAAGARTLAALLEEIAGSGSAGRVAARIERVLDATDYRSFIRAMEGEAERAEERLQNLDELVAAARQFNARSPEGDLAGFLQEVALLTDVDRWEQRADRVNLMTLHSAKGLEFRSVFICGAEDGLLPLRRPGDADDENVDWEEERRLLYVGMTRAKESLAIFWAEERMRRGALDDQVPSPFLAEIPPEELTGDLVREDEAWEDACAVEGDDDIRDGGAGIRAGALVRHARFGLGRVLRVWGRGRMRRATIYFDGIGEKQLVLAYARLRPLGDVDEIFPA